MNILKSILLSFIIVFNSCNQKSPEVIENEKHLKELLRQYDSSKREYVEKQRIQSLKPKPELAIISYAFSIVQYIEKTKEYIPKKVIGKGLYADGVYYEPLVIEEKWIDKETAYTQISPIREFANLTEDLKYKLMDETERVIIERNRFRMQSGSIRIKSREVRVYSSYADASKAIATYKEENGLGY